MKIAIGADHRGVNAARALADRLTHEGHDIQLMDAGCDEMCDYPDHAYLVGQAISQGRVERGVLIGIQRVATFRRDRHPEQAGSRWRSLLETPVAVPVLGEQR